MKGVILKDALVQLAIQVESEGLAAPFSAGREGVYGAWGMCPFCIALACG